MNMGSQTLTDLTVLDYESFFDDDDDVTEPLMKVMMSHSRETVSPRDGSSSNSNFSGSPRNESGPTRKASPIKRRLRASKKTQTNTTFLKANPSEFRAVVQRHTGRDSGYLLRRRGPINLNFAKNRNHRYVHESMKPASSADRDSLLVEERSSDDRRSFLYSSACETNDVSASNVVSGVTDTVLENPRPGPFSLVDGLDHIYMQNFPLPEFSGPDDDDDDDDQGCHDLLIIGDDFWG